MDPSALRGVKKMRLLRRIGRGQPVTHRVEASTSREVQAPVHIARLPDFIMLKILSYLSAEEVVCNIRATSRKWNAYSKEDELWRNLAFVPKVSMPDDILYMCFKNMPQLRTFILNHTRDCDLVIDRICVYCPQMKNINIRTKPGPSLSQIEKLLYKFPEIKCVNVRCFGSLMHIDFAKLNTCIHNPHILSLYINSTHYGYDFTLDIGMVKLGTYLLGQLTPIEKLRLELQERKNYLKCLAVSCKVTQESLNEICECKQLTYLLITNNDEVDDESYDIFCLLSLRSLETMQLLALENSDVGDVIHGIHQVDFHRITKLEVVKGGSALESVMNSLISLCKNLNHLNVQDNLLTDEDLSSIEQCSKLEYLDISKNPLLTNECLRKLSLGCRLLRYLDLTACPVINDDFILVIRNCNKLQTLRIEGEFFAGNHFRHLKTFFPELSEFHVYHVQDEVLYSSLKEEMPTLKIIQCEIDVEVCNYKW
ncbi:F-box/LRR-repeat protein 7-like [Periplaneta americana]|uniref:F-box/LRR-repeat protein 7-like n=1 Tax=Periplaneta americana TaxID=6978 RepID=UPI0037E923FD